MKNLAACAAAGLFAITLAGSPGCATLGALQSFVQPPQFDEAPGPRAEIRLTGPTRDAPIGGAAVRLWARVRNPNGFGFTLSTLRGTLVLDDSRAATVDLPLGLPLVARGAEHLPID